VNCSKYYRNLNNIDSIETELQYFTIAFIIITVSFSHNITTAAHFTTSGTTHHNTWAHRRGYTHIELTDGSAEILTAILEAPEVDQCWSKHVVHQWCGSDFKVLNELHVRRHIT
jgi:hypothetical protein